MRVHLCSEHKPVTHPRRIVRVPRAFETQVTSQLLHALVLVGVNGKHGTDAPFARDVDEVAHQDRSESLSLPCVGHGDRALARLGIGCEAVTAYADLVEDSTFA